jgi:hypothetical protein
MITAAFVITSANYDSALTVAVEHNMTTDDGNNNNVLDNKLFVSEYTRLSETPVNTEMEVDNPNLLDYEPKEEDVINNQQEEQKDEPEEEVWQKKKRQRRKRRKKQE